MSCASLQARAAPGAARRRGAWFFGDGAAGSAAHRAEDPPLTFGLVRRRVEDEAPLLALARQDPLRPALGVPAPGMGARGRLLRPVAAAALGPLGPCLEQRAGGGNEEQVGSGDGFASDGGLSDLRLEDELGRPCPDPPLPVPEALAKHDGAAVEEAAQRPVGERPRWGLGGEGRRGGRGGGAQAGYWVGVSAKAGIGKRRAGRSR